ncbi:hypothetical protein LguiB_033103 [Lonicera macranthoides]
METSTRHSRASQTQSSLTSKQRQSGYEPSDTETDWLETPWHEPNRKIGDAVLDQATNPSPLKLSRNSSKREVASLVKVSTTSPVRRRHSKSPYKPAQRDDNNGHSPSHASELRRNVSTLSPRPGPPGSDLPKNTSPFSKSERKRHVSPFKPVIEKSGSVNERHVSPYKPAREVLGLVNERHVSPYNPTREIRDAGNYEIPRSNGKQETSKGTEKSNRSHRSVSASRSKSRDKDRVVKNEHREQKRERKPSPLPRISPRKEREATHKHTPSVGEINEMFANAKISESPVGNVQIVENTDSISQGDIFFSHDQTALTMKKIIFPKVGFEEKISTKPKMGTKKVPNGSSDHNTHGIPNSNGLKRTKADQSSNISNVSGRTTESTKKFTANRQKSQSEAWFACIKKGPCRTSKKSPEKDRAFDEASFIEKAFVVENLRQFWADKHRPASLNGFTCHKQEAHLLKQLVSHEICPHIFLKGPPGSGKKALTMAFLRDIYGGPAWDISHDIRYFQLQEARPMQVAVPVTSSAHHVELNVYSEPNARYALMALVKQISSNHAVAPEISHAHFKADYSGLFLSVILEGHMHLTQKADISIMVLYDVDKASENIQHLIKWIMDCYTDVCKLVLCCEDDADILESVKSRCKVLKVDAPVTHEIMEVLIQIARKENFDLSMSFAAKIATKSKQNLRQAIMALEACKSHTYPFTEDQPISMGWEEVLVELAGEILANPSNKGLCHIRARFQKLLLDFVHPKLILQKLVEQFLKQVEASLKREIYYWHGYYEKRLPTGMSALLKLEEFVAKFMGIYRKSSGNHQYP